MSDDRPETVWTFGENGNPRIKMTYPPAVTVIPAEVPPGVKPEDIVERDLILGHVFDKFDGKIEKTGRLCPECRKGNLADHAKCVHVHKWWVHDPEGYVMCLGCDLMGVLALDAAGQPFIEYRQV